MKTTTSFIESSVAIFVQYKGLAEKAIAQITDDKIHFQPNPESNSIYLLVKHLSGNMLSRWTDFLTTDGEKDWRNRDDEFEDTPQTKAEMMEIWEAGWSCLFNALNPLSDADLSKIVTIRGEEHSVMVAIQRQLAHYSSHIGQIVYLAKIIQNQNWQTLSIARGKSNEFNNTFNPTR